MLGGGVGLSGTYVTCAFQL